MALLTVVRRQAGRTRFRGQLIRTRLGLVLNQLPLRGGPQVRPSQTKLRLALFQSAALRKLRLSLAQVRKDVGVR